MGMKQLVVVVLNIYWYQTKKNGRGKTGYGKCKLCNMRGIRRDTTFGCTGCNDYFHVDCYSILHARGALRGRDKVLDLVINSNENASENVRKFLQDGKRDKKGVHKRILINSIENVILPSK